MLSTHDIYRLQSMHSVSEDFGEDEGTDFKDYLNECRQFLTANMHRVRNKDGNTAENHKSMIKLIQEYVDKHNVKVKGYFIDGGIIDKDLLLNDLIDAVTGVGILKEAFDDEEIDEIQINDYKSIFVSRKGVLEPYIDSKGRDLMFSSDDEVAMVISRVIDDGTGNIPQFTPGHPILNAKTAKEHYRINAVHNSANAMDKLPNNFPMTSVVIRKFKEVKLELEDLIRSGSITEEMAAFIKILGRSGLKTFCVGPTGSGKTTLLNIIASNLPIDKRIILIQNPTEISLFERDEMGRNKRNVVHWEVKDSGDSTDDDEKATMPNLISNTLRATPEVMIVGEARTPGEFEQIMRVMKTGHPVLGTYHAEDSKDAVERFAEELDGGSVQSLRKVAKSIDFIISQHRFPDGTRRVMEISEIMGVDKDGEPIINTIFKFEMSGKYKINPENGLPSPEGYHKMINGISEDLKEKFFKYGISIDELQPFIRE